MLRMLAASKPFSANSASAASKMAVRVECARCCSARFLGAPDRTRSPTDVLLVAIPAHATTAESGSPVLHTRETEVVRDRQGAILLDGQHDERGLHTEDGVALQVLVALEEEVGHQLPVAGRADHEVHVRGAEGMSPQALQKLARRSVVGNRIADREDGPELVLAALVGPERGPEMATRLVLVL